MKIMSPVFQDNYDIPAKYSCDGFNENPPLEIRDVPPDTKSLALIVDDLDAPDGIFTHWVVWNIDPSTEKIEENTVPKNAKVGKNSSGQSNYTGPCPPSGTHRYFFKLYALDTVLNLNEADKIQLEDAMQDHILVNAELVGLYKKTPTQTIKT